MLVFYWVLFHLFMGEVKNVYIKHKRGIFGVSLFMFCFLLMGMKDVSKEDLHIQEDLEYASYKMDYLDTSPKQETKSEDRLEELFDKFEVRYELRDYFRKICLVYNIDATVAASLMQIESHSGHHKYYNVRTEDRKYYTYGVETWDEGLFQLSSYYADYFSEYFFNPELIASLGYIRFEYDPNDDYVGVQVGVAYLAHLYQRFQSYYVATIAYNCGPGRVVEGNIPEMSFVYAHAIKHNWKYREGDV